MEKPQNEHLDFGRLSGVRDKRRKQADHEDAKDCKSEIIQNRCRQQPHRCWFL